jgi:hypothetical protein
MALPLPEWAGLQVESGTWEGWQETVELWRRDVQLPRKDGKRQCPDCGYWFAPEHGTSCLSFMRYCDL